MLIPLAMAATLRMIDIDLQYTSVLESSIRLRLRELPLEHEDLDSCCPGSRSFPSRSSRPDRCDAAGDEGARADGGHEAAGSALEECESQLRGQDRHAVADRPGQHAEPGDGPGAQCSSGRY